MALDSFNILQIVFQIFIIKSILGIFHEIIFLFVKKKRIKLAKVNEILANSKIERSTEPNPLRIHNFFFTSLININTEYCR